MIGQRVSVHYNLHRCRAGGDPAPGESCFVLKLGGPSAPVAGMVPLAFNPFKDESFVLRDDRATPVREAARVVGDGRRTWAQAPAGEQS